ncbi:MAG: zinc resistance protein [Deltaproteobacteria bacterium]|nr:zinc resistance protein [Deltaproteobacteria bacterium]
MKKIIIAVSTILMAGFLAASAYAWGCGGMYGGGMYGMNGYGNYYGAGYNNSPNQSFYNDTRALRSLIAADRAELNALTAGANPDPKRARELSVRISNSEIELRNKAQQYNVPGMGMMGYGQGWNCGIAGHNHNFAGCW